MQLVHNVVEIFNDPVQGILHYHKIPCKFPADRNIQIPLREPGEGVAQFAEIAVDVADRLTQRSREGFGLVAGGKHLDRAGQVALGQPLDPPGDTAQRIGNLPAEPSDPDERCCKEQQDHQQGPEDRSVADLHEVGARHRNADRPVGAPYRRVGQKSGLAVHLQARRADLPGRCPGHPVVKLLPLVEAGKHVRALRYLRPIGAGHQPALLVEDIRSAGAAEVDVGHHIVEHIIFITPHQIGDRIALAIQNRCADRDLKVPVCKGVGVVDHQIAGLLHLFINAFAADVSRGVPFAHLPVTVRVIKGERQELNPRNHPLKQGLFLVPGGLGIRQLVVIRNQIEPVREQVQVAFHRL